MSEVEEFDEYIFFYNSETEFLKTVIQSVDASYVDCNSVKGEIVRNFGPALIVDIPITNPPYGKRMGKTSSMDELIAIFSSILKKQFNAWSVWILTNEKELVSKIKLRASEKIALKNGDIGWLWFKSDIFKGSKFRKERAHGNIG